jgi:hypothetical protein
MTISVTLRSTLLSFCQIFLTITERIGHVIITMLLLIIAALLAYALAAPVGILQRVMPRLLDITQLDGPCTGYVGHPFKNARWSSP